MHTNLLEKARQNRINALQTLERRKNNIFYLEDARSDRDRRNGRAVFVSRRNSVTPAMIAPPQPANANADIKIAA